MGTGDSQGLGLRLPLQPGFAWRHKETLEVEYDRGDIDATYALELLFYGDPSLDLPALGYGYEKEREWAIREFLSRRHNGQSKDINGGRSDALDQIERAANWCPPHKRSGQVQKFRSQTPVSWIRANNNKKNDARNRISAALDLLVQRRRAFTTVEL